MNVNYLYDYSLDELKVALKALNAPQFRAGQIFTALHQGIPVSDMTNLPKDLRSWLVANYNCHLPEIVTVQTSKDGTKKYLLAYRRWNEASQISAKEENLANVNESADLIECVLLNQNYGNTLCVSTQVGCRMGCRFCASGKNGLVRNLTAGEILAQVLLINRLHSTPNTRGVTNIVLMGSGEPLDNYDQVVRFLHLVTAPNGINISARNISLSTSGLVPQIKKFADEDMQVNLCISLHAPNDQIRQQIMPVAKRYALREVIDAAKYYFEKTHRRVIFEYSLMMKDGKMLNCAVEQARELANLVRGFPAHVNLINLNPLHFDTNAVLTSPSREIAMKFMDAVIKSGVSCTMRKNKGDDIDGACGQLRLRYLTNIK
ncbi:MAG: 23S rRNA (adenine(2503)-C(2))-methyltransferase RlmN [Prevotella sp.]|nr:23S rRNA (adenine(2503)-C(2))-methyltransferase RlmN [Prevotella sp.]